MYSKLYSDITFPCQINVTSLKAFYLFNYGSILTSWPIYAGGVGGGEVEAYVLYGLRVSEYVGRSLIWVLQLGITRYTVIQLP